MTGRMRERDARDVGEVALVRELYRAREGLVRGERERGRELQILHFTTVGGAT